MTKKMKPIVLAIMAGAAMLFLLSCKNKNEDITQTIDKKGSVETSIKVQHLDSTRDILVTTHNIWANDKLIKTAMYYDTMPALGIERTVAENEEGDTMPIAVKKEYQIFITVK